MGNGAKAAQKRERNAGKHADKGPTSRTKLNEAAKNIICSTCRQTFGFPVAVVNDTGSGVSFTTISESRLM
ncbi:hypothetical protein J3R83DRAFT_6893 [Lanmaoa asiatica]|nr:hypothetical protein J3R83DRAFT_6893 [Lanmaoa asiatica]